MGKRLGRPRTLSYDKEALSAAVVDSDSWAEVHRKMGLSISGASYKALRRSCEEYEIDFSHFTGRNYDRSKAAAKIQNWGGRYPLDDLLTRGVKYSPQRLKRRLLKEELIEDRCVACRQGPEWNGKPLTLQLDHINGDSSDNRLENLQVLCPNCHTQTPTWGSKKRHAPSV